MPPRMPHRGRFQAQGPNQGEAIEESVPWNRELPPTNTDGYQMLNTLRDRLSAQEQQERLVAFAQARQFVDRAATAGGVRAIVRKSYPSPARRDGRRVDVEVLAGVAFVKTGEGGNA
jgi:hypothetical protein